MKKLIFFLLVLVNLTSCVGFHDAPDVWVMAEGLWLVPLLTFLGALWFLYLSYKASKSNSTTDNQNGTISDNTGNVPMYKVGKFKYFVVLLVVTIGLLVFFNSPWHS